MTLSPLSRLDAQLKSHVAEFLPLTDQRALACTSRAFKDLLKNVHGGHPCLYKTRGAQTQNGTTTFRVYAPHANNVSVILTSYGHKEHEVAMRKTADGVWKAVTSHASPGRTYLYRVEDCNGKVMMRTDPFSFSAVSVPEVGQVQSVVVDQERYKWGDGEWMQKRAGSKPLESPLSIYEVHIKSWMKKGHRPMSYREVAPEIIAYCKKMNFTHVEFYGIMEHMYDLARGYRVANYFAPYNPLGSCDDVKYLIDQLHQNGIGVILLDPGTLSA